MHIPMLVQQLLPLLYRGAGNPSSWTAFLALLCEGLEARMAAVVASDEQHNVTFLQHSGMDRASQQACATRFLEEAPRRAHSAPPSRTASPVPQGIGPFATEPVPLSRFHQADVALRKMPGFSHAGITILRSTKQASFNAEELSFLEQLAPHVEGALLLQQQFTSLKQGEGLLDRLSRSFDLAYILLDGGGRPQLISTLAQQFLRHGSGLRLQDGRLHAELPREHARLRKLLAAACTSPSQAERGMGGETTMTITRPGCNKPLQITMQPLHKADEASCAVLFLRDPAAQPASRAAVLREMYRLLPSEVRLAESLSDGLDVKHAAVRMHITENSARTLLKSVFRKLEVNSQAGLIRTVLTLPAE